ncbi:hypothetical protein BC628DRAFT_169045 [Trametes gibbosa]|nr:hypothetical protein BC628DRAFT_169045 [Trametes gibbosa]
MRAEGLSLLPSAQARNHSSVPAHYVLSMLCKHCTDLLMHPPTACPRRTASYACASAAVCHDSTTSWPTLTHIPRGRVEPERVVLGAVVRVGMDDGCEGDAVEELAALPYKAGNSRWARTRRAITASTSERAVIQATCSPSDVRAVLAYDAKARPVTGGTTRLCTYYARAVSSRVHFRRTSSFPASAVLHRPLRPPQW